MTRDLTNPRNVESLSGEKLALSALRASLYIVSWLNERRKQQTQSSKLGQKDVANR